jgi:hypothetical protein
MAQLYGFSLALLFVTNAYGLAFVIINEGKVFRLGKRALLKFHWSANVQQWGV